MTKPIGAGAPGAPVPPYSLVRSRRKTLAIHITKDAAVEVRAPLNMPIRDIERFIAAKEKWIKTHLAKRETIRNEKAAFALHYGDALSLCGRQYPITAREGVRIGFDGACFFLPPGLPPDSVKDCAVQIYKLTAKQVIALKTEEYAKRLRVTPAGFHITSAKTRWGSCSAKKSLNFSWRLMMADDDVIDYVVVHELAHIKELNHSSRFWALVASIFPDYKERNKKLKLLQEKLALQDWG
jgi:predicted metal-dependent hydrolase